MLCHECNEDVVTVGKSKCNGVMGVCINKLS